MNRWKGRVALVTGASVGIGAALVRKFAECEMQVIGCARNVQQIQVRSFCQVRYVFPPSQLLQVKIPELC